MFSIRYALPPALLLTCIVGGFAYAEDEISFRYDVLAVLSKQGCSAGACHGSPSGKGGFRLSLRGFDPNLDQETLVREEFGRRIDTVSPEKSLLLQKPLMRVAHGGGARLREGDAAYRILLDWIASGADSREVNRPQCVDIDVTPNRIETRGTPDPIPLKVIARFDDGSEKDITQWAIYSCSDDSVAAIDDDGIVRVSGRGEATILIRYLDFIDTTSMTVERDVDGFEWPSPTPQGQIDRLIFARLRRLKIPPSDLCGDSEFIRRLYLDVLGILPSRADTEGFLADTSPDKRARLIDRLLERKEHASFWAQKRADLLRVRASKIGAEGVRRTYDWLVDAVASNMPYDEFARQLLTAQGSTDEHPAANYYRAAQDIQDCAETTSQLFLGIRIQCAKCHNHPFDRWSQDNYYGIAAFFNQVERIPEKEKTPFTISLADKAMAVIQPRTGEKVRPWLPDEGFVDHSDQVDRRIVFADWLTKEGNPYFARVAVNRIWGELFGRGLVDPVDDFSAANPPSHPDVLDYLANRFSKLGYDQKELIREILQSRTYQTSSRTNTLNAADSKYFSHAAARMLQAEQLMDAIVALTSVKHDFPGVPEGTLATALPSPDSGNDFLKTFGQPDRNSACECERRDGPDLSRALQLINGSMIAEKIRSREGRIGRLYDDVADRVKAAGGPPQRSRVAWFRADSGAMHNGEPAKPGELVSYWTNRDNQTMSTTQTQESSRPRYIPSAVHGLPAIRFDGRDDFLTNATADLLPSGSPRTIVVVGKASDETGGALVTFGRQRTGGASIFTVQHIRIGGSYYVYSDGVNGAGNTTLPPGDFATLKRPFVTTYLSEGVGKKLVVRVNGEQCAASQPGGVGVDKGSSGFTIGSREDLPLGNQVWSGDIAEVLVFREVLDPQTLKQVERYLAVRYDLPLAYERPHFEKTKRLSGDLVQETIQDCYYTAFSRPATRDEMQYALKYVAAADDQRTALEDLIWAMLNSREFLFQH